MVVDLTIGLPYLASGIITSFGLIMLIHSFSKGFKRLKYWIISISIHNIALYVEFINKSFLESKYIFVNLSLSGIALIFLIFVSLKDYLVEFPLNQNNERTRLIRYAIYSLFMVIIYFIILNLNFQVIQDVSNYILYSLFSGLIFANILLFQIYKKKKIPTHMSMLIILILIGVDVFFSILDYAVVIPEFISFTNVFETADGIGILFFGFISSVENQLLKQTQDKLISQTQLSSIQIIAGGFAHDFNNILTAIIGNVSLIEDYPILQEGEGKEFIDDLKSASFQAKNMTNQLLVFSKGEEFLNKEIIGFTDIIEITTKFTMRGRKSKPIFDIDEDLWAIYGDPIQISQIIQNLTINADQAMPQGGIIELHAHNIEFRENNQFKLNPGRYIHFRIIDSGTGIPHNIQEKIFSPFFTTKREGKGFGLSICKKIIEDHKGYMNFDTTIGKGTEFYFCIPAKAKITKKDENHDVVKERFSGFALILDDNFLVLRVIENLLKNLGMTAISSSESSTFLTTFENMVKKGKKIDLLIVDLTLPGDIGGEIIISKIRNINPNAYVVVSSGYSENFVMKNYRDYGFNDFLRKPYNKAEVIKVLKKVFSKN